MSARFAVADILPCQPANRGQVVHGTRALDHVKEVSAMLADGATLLQQFVGLGWQVSADECACPQAWVFGQFASLHEAVSAAQLAGAPRGTIIEWVAGRQTHPKARVAIGGAVIGGPCYGEGNAAQAVVTDCFGVQRLCNGDPSTLAQIRQAIEAHAVLVARCFPQDHEVAIGAAQRAGEIRLTDDMVQRIRLSRVGEREYAVVREPADRFRFLGFKTGILHPDRPDMAGRWPHGPVVTDLALEGHEMARDIP